MNVLGYRQQYNISCVTAMVIFGNHSSGGTTALTVRSNNTNYSLTAVADPASNDSTLGRVMTVNPATSLPWTYADVNALEVGVTYGSTTSTVNEIYLSIEYIPIYGRLKVWNNLTNAWEYVSTPITSGVQTINGETGAIQVAQTASFNLANLTGNYISGSVFGPPRHMPQNAQITATSLYATTTGSISVTFRRGSYTGSMLGNMTIGWNNSYANSTMTGSGWNIYLYQNDLIYYIVDTNSNNINAFGAFVDYITQ
jgi:hypothetical protein